MARTQRTQRSLRSPVARLCSVVALAFAFVGQLCSVVHMAVVKHETCAEHGELVEGSAAAPLAELDVDALGRADSAESHDHCPLATTPSHHERSVVLAVEDVPRALERAVAVLDVEARAVDVLRVAPKTSPPALA